MAYTLGAAAKATGRNKTTILRAIKDGKISALRDAASGAWLIEPAELHRVYPAVADTTHDTTESNPDAMGELREMRARLADAQDQIRDLRQQRDREAEERRQVQARLDALLTDQRQASPAASPQRRRWWHRK